MKKIPVERIVFILILFLSFSSINISFARITGRISGVVKEEATGNPLPGANVYLKGTSFGASTNYDGEYFFRVPPGSYKLVVNYIGYRPEELSVQVIANKTSEHNFKLTPATVEGQEVVVTAIREGQAAAINRQLTSNTIVNIVSAERIQELPDANAAESVGRLPGVTMQRESGEGEKVLIRGLSARFTAVSINGERIPATEGYKLGVADDDRSVDLSLISQDALAGIEVFKALTPDMDGDAVGGAVNFVLIHAPKGFRYRADTRNGYMRHDDEFGQTLNTFTISNRFLKDKLGVYASVSYEYKNTGSDQMNAGYSVERGATIEDLTVRINRLTLTDRLASRKRYNGSLILDYEIPNHSFLFTNTAYRKFDEGLTRDARYDFDTKIYNPGLDVTEVDIIYYNNALSGKHQFWGMEADWRVSHSLSHSQTPFSNNIWFQRESVFGPIDTRWSLDKIFNTVRYDPMETYLYGIQYREKESRDRNYNLSFDMKLPFNIGKQFSGYVKFGGKNRAKKRSAGNLNSLINVYNTAGGWLPAEDPDSTIVYYVDDKNNVLMPTFINPTFNADPFLGGKFVFANQLDEDMAGRKFYHTHYGYGDKEGYGREVDDQTNADYSNTENISAAYLMGQFHFSRFLMVMAGIRYERDDLEYHSFEQLFTDPANPRETETFASVETDLREQWLPMFHLKIKPLTWFDIRLAATRSLSRPNYTRLRPRFIIDRTGQNVYMSGLDLKNATAWNYDIVFSFFNNMLGLFTVGAYYKDFKNIDYPLTERNWSNEEYGFTPQQALFGYTIHRFVNAPVSTIKGVEVDLQTNLSFLPSPFDGIIINANFTRAITETPFPQFKWEKTGSFPRYEYKFWRENRYGKMPGNAENLGNFAIGYEKWGFSCRVSYFYQGDFLSSVGAVPEQDTYVKGWHRWDLILKQKITRRISISLDLQNISDQEEAGYQYLSNKPTYSQFYGWRMYLGLRYDAR